MKSTLFFAIACGLTLSAAPALAATPDGVLTTRTKLSLLTSVGLRSNAVHVDTDDGVVTLYGKVTTGAQRELAEKAAADIDGVRAVRNLLQVVPDTDEKSVDRADGEIGARVEEAIKADSALEESKIFVKSVDKGLVLLTGEARTLSDHLRAVVIVDRVPGVRRVISEIKSPEVFGFEESAILHGEAKVAKTPFYKRA